MSFKVVWYVNGVPLTESEKIKMISEDGICLLTIQDVSRHFDGIVTCQVKASFFGLISIVSPITWKGFLTGQK